MIISVVTVAVLIVAVAGAGAAYLLLRTVGTPRQTAQAYLAAWQSADYQGMNAVSVNKPAGGLAPPLQQVATDLGQRSLHLRLGTVTENGGSAQAGFTATAALASGHTWSYQGRLALVKRDRHWWVNWSPAAIYPRLQPGERFALSATWPARAGVLAADGTDLSSPQAIGQSGSLSLMVGDIVKADAKQAKALGAPYRAGDLIGSGGIEQAYQAQLAGRPAMTITIQGPDKKTDATAAHFPGEAGHPVHTSIDMRYQLAASAAVSAANTSKNIDVVALQPSTGKILAVVERPGGFDRALEGVFPPGSTFKIVTASALARKGMRPSSTVQCPPTVTLGGRTFHNFDNEHFGTTSLLNAFAV
jgi:hypothetical protein